MVALVLLYGVVYPNAGLVVASFDRGLDLYRDVLGQAATREAIVTSLLLSLATVAGCAVVGGGLAILLDRVDVPYRRALSAVAVAPLLLPPLVGTVAFIFLFSESGLVTRATMRLFGLAEAPYRLKGFGAVLLFHVYTIYPYFFVFVSAALKRVDPSLEEAARTLGASPWQRFGRVLLPALRGALGAGALATFMTSMASFSAPFLFGGTMRVLTLQIYEAKTNNERGLAVVMTVLLAALSLTSLVAFARLDRPVAGGAGKGISQRARRPLGPGARGVAMAAGAVLAAIVLLPHVALVLISFAKVETWTTQVLPPVYTVANYARVWSERRFLDPIANSALMASVSAAANLVFGVAAAYLVTRYAFRGRGLVTLLLLVPWALPGTVLAYQLVEAYSGPSVLTAGAALAGSYWLLPFVYFVRNMPLVTRAVAVNLTQMDASLEPAARTLGAGWLTAVVRVVLPLVLPGAVAGTMLAFSLALGEFVASIVAYVFSNRPISIGIDQALRQGDLGAAAAYGVFLMAAIGAALGLGSRIETRGMD